MWVCKHCNKEFDFSNTSEKANHSRWCDDNPKRNNWDKTKASILKYGEFKDFEVECENCKISFAVNEREKLFPQKSKYFCSRSCANTRERPSDVKKKISESLTGKVYVEPKIIERICKCGTTFTYLKKGNRERKYCSRSCGTKYAKSTIKRKEEARLKRTALGNYRRDCNFKFNLKDYPNEFNFKLVEKYGWYKAKNRGNNLNGVSRDHIISVRYGFDNNIDPKIISHPANCQLLRHNDNVSKCSKCNLTLEQLLIKIEKWNKKYNF